MNEERTFINEIESQLSFILSKRGFHSKFRRLHIIERWYFIINFDYYEGEAINWNIRVFARKLDWINSISNIKHKTEKKLESFYLQDDANYLLGRSIAKGSLIERWYFSNCLNINEILNIESFCINVSSNTLTIFCK